MGERLQGGVDVVLLPHLSVPWNMTRVGERDVTLHNITPRYIHRTLFMPLLVEKVQDQIRSEFKFDIKPTQQGHEVWCEKLRDCNDSISCLSNYDEKVLMRYWDFIQY